MKGVEIVFLYVYIGDLQDAEFSYEQGNWNGNIPERISPNFPATHPFHLLLDKIKSGEFEGKQVDWAAWVSKVKPNQILDFIEECYKDYKGSKGELRRLVKIVNKLDKHKFYGLVAFEDVI